MFGIGSAGDGMERGPLWSESGRFVDATVWGPAAPSVFCC